MKRFLLFFILCSACIIVTQSVQGADTEICVAPQYSFDFQLIPVDAQTKGAISLNTRLIELGVLITNRSSNVTPKEGVSFAFSEGYIRNARGLQLQGLETNNGLLLSSGLDSMHKRFIYTNVSPTAVKTVLPKDILIAHLKVKIIIYGPSVAGRPARVLMQKEVEVEDVAYAFNNQELIPVVLNYIEKNK